MPNDMKQQINQTRKTYSKGLLGAFKNGRMLYNNADHPEHANFEQLDHMRASAIHSKMAGEKEQAKDYIRAAHHREQATKHKSKWKATMPSSPFIKSDDKKPKIQLVPHPPEVIDVDPKRINDMKRRLSPEAHKFLALVRDATSGPRPMDGQEPPYTDEAFKAKLNSIVKPKI